MARGCLRPKAAGDGGQCDGILGATSFDYQSDYFVRVAVWKMLPRVVFDIVRPKLLACFDAPPFSSKPVVANYLAYHMFDAHVT